MSIYMGELMMQDPMWDESNMHIVKEALEQYVERAWNNELHDKALAALRDGCEHMTCNLTVTFSDERPEDDPS